MRLVRRLVKMGEDFSIDTIQEHVTEYVPRVKEFSTRQFRARYARRVMDRVSRSGPGADGPEPAGPPSGELRPALRRTLVDFAREVVAAEDRGEVVELVENVDEYVDRVMKEA